MRTKHCGGVMRGGLAVISAVAGFLVVASVASAAPTGSITFGQWLSTGQITATFVTTSDFVEPSGYGGWFPSATTAAAGEPCVAGSSSVVYVGTLWDNAGTESSGPLAVYADFGETVCLWVVHASHDYLVAQAAVPPKPAPPPAPPPAPSPTPAPPSTPPAVSPPTNGPYLGSIEVVSVLRGILVKTYGAHFTKGRYYRRSCRRLSSRSFRCRVSWTWRRWRYGGTVRIRDDGDGYTYWRSMRRTRA